MHLTVDSPTCSASSTPPSTTSMGAAAVAGVASVGTVPTTGSNTSVSGPRVRLDPRAISADEWTLIVRMPPSSKSAPIDPSQDTSSHNVGKNTRTYDQRDRRMFRARTQIFRPGVACNPLPPRLTAWNAGPWGCSGVSGLVFFCGNFPGEPSWSAPGLERCGRKSRWRWLPRAPTAIIW